MDVSDNGSLPFARAAMPFTFPYAPVHIAAWPVGVTLGKAGRAASAQAPVRNISQSVGAVSESENCRIRDSLNPSKLMRIA